MLCDVQEETIKAWHLESPSFVYVSVLFTVSGLYSVTKYSDALKL